MALMATHAFSRAAASFLLASCFFRLSMML
jgi:hypothetical protein